MSDKYNKADIWYFTGTGNARFAANQIAENCNEVRIPTTVYNIAGNEPRPPKYDRKTLLGFCFPTHGFLAPPLVLKFLFRFPKGKADVFLLNTRAGLKLSKLHMPGIGGLALWVPTLILWLKGYRVIGFRPLDMPSNWISLHPGVRKKVVSSVHDHCTKTLERFSARILQGKPVLNGLLWLPIDLFVAPVAFAYYFLGRFALAKTYFANYKCNNCNLCIDECPVEAVIEKDGRPYWKFTCESCMHCMNVCPHKAIDTAHAFVIPLWWLVFSFLPYGIMRAMLWLGWLSEAFYRQYFDLIFYAILIPVSFALIFYSYSLLHRLLGTPWINKLISYTSLTHYSWWRRYYIKQKR